jgi:hypothetical protein
MLDNLKTQLGSTDEEFAALEPKLQKVIQAQADVGAGNGGGRGGMFGAGGGGGRRNNGGGAAGAGGANPPAATPLTSVQQAQQDLRTTLDNKSATPEEIKDKIDALRQARAKAKEDLVAAQADLKTVLTQRQEAVLILFGMLD